jgi:hypothetical protein
MAMLICLITIFSLAIVRIAFRNTYNNIKWSSELLFVQIVSRPLKKSSVCFPERVAHGGGTINGITYTNSFDALNSSYKKGCRFFEVDLELTADDKIVLMHDWKRCVLFLFGKKKHIYSLDEFKKEKAINNVTLMSISDFENWLKEKNDVRIIGDTKENTFNIYRKIEEENPIVFKRLIPQIYYMWQYPFVKNIGYENMILTLYEAGYSDKHLIRFEKLTNISAITMNIERVIETSPMKLYNKGIFVFAHTVNDKKIIDCLLSYGLRGVYTDSLLN